MVTKGPTKKQLPISFFLLILHRYIQRTHICKPQRGSPIIFIPLMGQKVAKKLAIYAFSDTFHVRISRADISCQISDI